MDERASPRSHASERRQGGSLGQRTGKRKKEKGGDCIKRNLGSEQAKRRKKKKRNSQGRKRIFFLSFFPPDAGLGKLELYLPYREKEKKKAFFSFPGSSTADIAGQKAEEEEEE